MAQLKEKFIESITDQIGEEINCYLINCQNLAGEEIDFLISLATNFKFLYEEPLHDPKWPTQKIFNSYALCDYNSQPTFIIFKVGTYEISLHALTGPKEEDIYNTLKNKSKIIEKLFEEKDPFKKTNSLIYLEKYLLEKEVNINNKINFKLKI